jgi:ATP-dependent DNA ligase
MHGFVSDDQRKAVFARMNSFSAANAAILSGEKRSEIAMLAKPVYEKEEVETLEDDWVACEKYDGIRTMTVVNNDKIEMFNPRRRGDDITLKFPDLVDDIKEAFMDDQPIIVDGEISYRKGEHDYFHPIVARLNTNDPEKLQDYIRETPAEYRVFDILEYRGEDTKDLPLMERRQLLDKALGEDRENLKLERCVAENKMDYAEEEMKAGKEGVVFKDLNSKYEQNKRSGSWAKFKKPEGGTFVVYGIERGSGSNSDKAGSLLIGKYIDGEFAEHGKVGSGLSNEERNMLWKKFGGNGQDVINLPESSWFGVDLKYMEEDKRGGLRHPRIERLRTELGVESLRGEQ